MSDDRSQIVPLVHDFFLKVDFVHLYEPRALPIYSAQMIQTKAAQSFVQTPSSTEKLTSRTVQRDRKIAFVVKNWPRYGHQKFHPISHSGLLAIQSALENIHQHVAPP